MNLVNYTRRSLPRRLLQTAVDTVARRLQRREQEVTLVFAGEQRMRTLNKRHRGKDSVTDVLSFFDGTAGYWGEIIICPEQLERQARELNTSYREELLFIVVHGLLHLGGYSDETAAGWEEMQILGTKLCASIMGKER